MHNTRRTHAHIINVANAVSHSSTTNRSTSIWRNVARNRFFGISFASLYLGSAGFAPLLTTASPTNGQVPRAPAVQASPPNTGFLRTGNDVPVAATLFPVWISDGGTPAKRFEVSGTTVRQALKSAGVSIGTDDRVVPAPPALIHSGIKICVTRVHSECVIKRISLPFKTIFRMSQDIAPGTIRYGHGGSAGERLDTYRTFYLNGKPVHREMLAERIVRTPTDQETLAGIRLRSARALPSRGGVYRRMKCYNMTATGYSPFEGSGQGRCATGMAAGYGVVAVDPRVIPLHSKLYIEGYGYAIAGDTGGAIKGMRVDLGSTTHRDACLVGRRRVKVWLLNGN